MIDGKEVYKFILKEFHNTTHFVEIDNKRQESVLSKHTVRYFLKQMFDYSYSDIQNLEKQLFGVKPDHTTILNSIDKYKIDMSRLYLLEKQFTSDSLILNIYNNLSDDKKFGLIKKLNDKFKQEFLYE